MRIEWLPRAERDLDSQLDHIAKDNPTAAVDAGDRVFDHIEHLINNPAMGKPGRRAGTRELVVPRTPWIVVYRALGERVQILRILHGSQRWP